MRSARLPGVIEPAVAVEPERAGAAERGELERAPRCQRVRAPLPGARADDRCAQLVEHVERRRRRGAVRRDADPDSGVPKRRQGRDPAAEERVRARAVRDRDVVCGEQLDLLRHLPGRSARRGRAGRAAPRRRAPGSRSGPAEARAALRTPASFRCRCGGTRSRRRSRRGVWRPGRPSSALAAVEVERAGVGRVRRDAEADALGERSRRCARASARTARGAETRPRRRPRGTRSRGSPSSAHAVAAAPLKLQSPTVVIPERRHSSAPRRAIASMPSRSSRCFRSTWSGDPGAERRARRRTRRRRRTRGGCGRSTKPGRITDVREAARPRRAPRPSRPPRSARRRLSRPRRSRSDRPRRGRPSRRRGASRRSGAGEVVVPRALPAALHEHGEPDRELEQKHERDDFEGKRDGVDGREQDREDEEDDKCDPPVARAGGRR